MVLVGAVIGVIARFLMPGRDPIGFVGTILLGIVGAVLGTWLWEEIFPDNDNAGVAMFAGIVVAMVLLFIYRKIAYGRSSTALR
jgi:uncharacterized membrane protein YeaQ/YmgE (transglycosylase-associated protein family)